MMAIDTAPAVLLAPDSFKGTLSAEQVAGYMAAGAAEAGWRSVACPLADGGEGTLTVFASAGPMRVCWHTVHDPFGDQIAARLLVDNEGVAFLEAAEAVGLGRAREPDPHSALIASSTGVGELINRALSLGAHRIIVGVGGSATSDGGAGLLGVLDLDRWTSDVRVEVLTDSTTPYEDAAQVFSRQKGADSAGISWLTERLDSQAAKLPKDPRGVPGTGCGGGMSGALWAHGAVLRPGADAVMDLLGIDDQIEAADLVISGEGSLDAQTLTGKLVERLAQRAAQQQRRFAVIAGRISLDTHEQRALGLAGMRQAGVPDSIRVAARELCQEAAS